MSAGTQQLAGTGVGYALPTDRSTTEASRAAAAEAIDWGKFGLLLLQLVGLACVAKRFELESAAYFEMTLFAAVGFTIQYFLPLAARSGFFLLLSLASIVSVLGMASGTCLVAIGLALIGITHLPISLAARIGILCVAGVALSVLRSGWIDVPFSAAVWPVLGSMFMFRLIVYVYDLKHGQAPESWTQRLSYFFMFPNICFLLFPVVDSRAYTRSWFAGERHDIHQVGVEWVLRGSIQLLLYRLVYSRLGVDPYDVANSADLVHYCVWLFLLYLRVSGQFHVIVGLLHLFGFNLPETHRQYYLASSFTDFWRRINIYWKDFMMKVFYYPAFFRLRGRGQTFALVVSTAYVFVWTWVLHALQLYWIRGTYTFTWNDPLFWTILCVLVTINAMWEVKRGRRRVLGAESRPWQDSLVLALKTLATFIVICTLWSFWCSESVEFWLSLLPAAAVMPDADQATKFGLTVVAVLAGVACFMAWNRWVAPQINRRFEWRAAFVLGQLFLLNAISVSAVYQQLGPAGKIVAGLRFGGLNEAEMEQLERGYYEDLLTVDRFNGELAALYMKRPPEWAKSLDEVGLLESVAGAPYRLRPNSDALFKGAMLRTNRWGMHDRDYAEEKPARTYRIALLGASHTMGTGVAAAETMDGVFEKRLNEELVGEGYPQFEVLNFAVYGYNPIEQIQVLDERVHGMNPDAMFYVGHPGDAKRVVQHVLLALRDGRRLPHAYLDDVVKRAGIEPKMPPREVHRRLTPYGDEILAWVYGELVERCRSHDVHPVFVLLPMAVRALDNQATPREVTLAEAAGFTVFNLHGVYDGEDESSLWIAEWDAHPNVLGHRVVGDRLFELFKQSQQLLVSRL